LSKRALSFQDLIFRLQEFWGSRGCVIQTPYDVEVGAGTMCPETFLRVLGPEPYRVAYVQPSRRPADGRYGDNPNRLFKHWQFQVILKPTPDNIQDLYLKSLEKIGIDLRQHDIKFEEDNWASPTLGAWGIGWQVMLDGLEITQFTYFQQCGGLDLDPVPVELTYGLERIAAFLQDVDSVYEIQWNPPAAGARVFTYGDVRYDEELQFSVYNFEEAGIDLLWQEFELHEKECRRLLDEFRAAGGEAGAPAVGEAGAAGVPAGLPNGEAVERQRRFPVLAAYDHVLKCSHLFNLLDSRGAISVTERVAVIGRVRHIAVGVAQAWLEQRTVARRRRRVSVQAALSAGPESKEAESAD